MAKSSRVKSKGKSKPAPNRKAKPAVKAKAKPGKKAPMKAAPKKAAPKKAAPMKAAPMKAAPMKAAPMKAAPMKAAPMKAAPMKAAPMKAAEKLPPAKGAGNAGATTSSGVDEGWEDVETSAPRRPAKAVSSDHRKKVEQHVLRLYQSTIDPDAALPTVLSVDPNDHDLDPSPFYEALEDAFKVEDPSKHEFAGYGGTIEHTINFIAGRWKGGELKQSGDDSFE